MKAHYDSTADAIAIDLVDEPRIEHGDELSDRAIVDVGAGDAAVGVQLLYLRGEEEQTLSALGGVAERYGLDREALEAAARAALAAPDRQVRIDVDAEVPA